MSEIDFEKRPTFRHPGPRGEMNREKADALVDYVRARFELGRCAVEMKPVEMAAIAFADAYRECEELGLVDPPRSDLAQVARGVVGVEVVATINSLGNSITARVRVDDATEALTKPTQKQEVARRVGLAVVDVIHRLKMG